MQNIQRPLAEAVAKGLKQLLSEKHLYQYVNVDTGFIRAIAELMHQESTAVLSSSGRAVKRMSVEEAEVLCVGQTTVLWHPNGVTTNQIVGFASGSEPLEFELPTINTFCDRCQDRPPFNPVNHKSFWLSGASQRELYLLGYQCQQCKGGPIHFLVRREGLKLRLAGRYPLEALPTPKVLPKGVSNYFGDAQIAHHAGQTLAGLFLLRVFIEQYWRTIPEVQKLLVEKRKPTGDEQGDAYQSKLPLDFKSRFPSLKDVYDELSAALHSASADAALFDASCGKIVEHFDARRLYKIRPELETVAKT